MWPFKKKQVQIVNVPAVICDYCELVVIKPIPDNWGKLTIKQKTMDICPKCIKKRKLLINGIL